MQQNYFNDIDLSIKIFYLLIIYKRIDLRYSKHTR